MTTATTKCLNAFELVEYTNQFFYSFVDHKILSSQTIMATPMTMSSTSHHENLEPNVVVIGFPQNGMRLLH